MPVSTKCFNCNANGEEFYGYYICESCKSNLKLFTDFKIMKYIAEYNEDKERTFKEEMEYRLDFVEKDYIKKKIKLKYILDRIKEID